MPDPIVLAFSGGLDTSFCIPWLAETLGRPVGTITVENPRPPGRAGGPPHGAPGGARRRARRRPRPPLARPGGGRPPADRRAGRLLRARAPLPDRRQRPARAGLSP